MATPDVLLNSGLFAPGQSTNYILDVSIPTDENPRFWWASRLPWLASVVEGVRALLLAFVCGFFHLTCPVSLVAHECAFWQTSAARSS